MDDIFTLLIYLFIIISFFSSFFKKKEQKPPVQKRRAPSSDDEVTVAQNPASRQEETSILSEIENLFKENYDVEKPLPQAEIPSRSQGTRAASGRTVLKQAEEENAPTASEHMYQSDWEKQRRQLDERKKRIDDKLVDQALKFEKLLSDRRVKESSAAVHLRKRLGDPDNLSEYLIIGEILQRPKALRR